MNADRPDNPESLVDRERRGLFRNVMAAGLGQAGAIVFGLGAMVVTTRLLGPEGYGTLTVFFMALGIVTQVLLGWPNVAVVRFGREEMRDTGGIGATLWARAALFGLCAAVVAAALVLWRKPVAAYLGMGPAAVWVLLGYALLLAGVEMFAAVFQVLGRFRAMAALGAGAKLLNFALLILLYLAFTRQTDAQTVLVLHVVSLACIFLVGGAGALWAGSAAPRLDGERVRRMAAYAWPIVLGGIASVVVGWIDTAVINHYRPRQDVGAYGAAYQVVFVLGGVRAAVLCVAWPLIMSVAAEERHETLRWYLDDFLMTGTIMLGVALAAVGIAAEAIPWALGSGFTASMLLCQVLVAGVAFTAFRAMIVNVANAYDRVKYVVATSVAVALVNLGGDLALVPRMGPMGAALSTVVAYAVGAVLVLAIVNRVSEVRGAAPGRRFLAVAGFLPALGVPALACCIGRGPLRVAALVAMLILWCLVVRAAGWFNRATLQRLERIELPPAALWALRMTYAALARREARA